MFFINTPLGVSEIVKKTQVHVSLLPLVFLIVRPKAVYPESFSGDPVHIVLSFYLFNDNYPHIFVLVAILLEVVRRFCPIISP